MIRGLAIALLLAMLASLATCQTFQYSRGWTNGKRAETSPLASMLDFKAAMAGAAGRMNDLQARCADLHKWRMFLVRSSDNEEVCRVPCEFLDVLRQCLIRQDKASSLTDLSDFRRSSAPALETSSSLSY